jgi:response regulator NasT
VRIAIADDEAFIRRYFQEILPDMGHEVVSAAANGRELVEHCRDKKPDLIISDVRMPEMDGIDAALEISRERPVPIVLVSAYHDPDLIERAETSSVMAYLIKPIQRGDLEAAIAIARRRFEQMSSSEREVASLRKSLEDRKFIERAKGILMKKANIPEDEAFRRMQRMASDTNRKLADVAKLILAAEETQGLFEPGK